MTPSKEPIKQVTIRWSEDFWEQVSIAATKRRTSVQAIVTEAVAKLLGIAPPDSDQAAA
jgi:predicted HicB family RNase H-like nuclease